MIYHASLFASLQIGKVDGPWNYSPTQHFGMQQSLVAQQLASSGQPAFANIHPGSQQLNASHLAEQLDSSLHISSIKFWTCVLSPFEAFICRLRCRNSIYYCT